jgi:hypothetical protein
VQHLALTLQLAVKALTGRPVRRHSREGVGQGAVVLVRQKCRMFVWSNSDPGSPRIRLVESFWLKRPPVDLVIAFLDALEDGAVFLLALF